MVIDYPIMLRDLFKQYTELLEHRNKIDVDLTKLTQVIHATFNMLTPEQQEKAEATDFQEFLESHALGLSEAIRMALFANTGKWMTPPEIRDYLNGIGFDFGQYIANPLTSIGTTLKRMSEELETKTLDGGQIAYRRKVYSFFTAANGFFNDGFPMTYVPLEDINERKPEIITDTSSAALKAARSSKRKRT